MNLTAEQTPKTASLSDLPSDSAPVIGGLEGVTLKMMLILIKPNLPDTVKVGNYWHTVALRHPEFFNVVSVDAKRVRIERR